MRRAARLECAHFSKAAVAPPDASASAGSSRARSLPPSRRRSPRRRGARASQPRRAAADARARRARSRRRRRAAAPAAAPARRCRTPRPSLGARRRRARRRVPARRPARGRRAARGDGRGNVELRTRRETVLADWLPTTSIDGRGPRQGQRHAAQGHRLDHRPRGQLPARHARPAISTIAARSRSARPARAATRSRSASPAPTTTRSPTARYTTCVAPRDDWYLRGDELEVDNRARSAPRTTRRCDFLDVPVLLLAVARVSAVERAQVGVPDADDRVDRARAASRSRCRTTSTSRRTTTRRSRRGS